MNSAKCAKGSGLAVAVVLIDAIAGPPGGSGGGGVGGSRRVRIQRGLGVRSLGEELMRRRKRKEGCREEKSEDWRG